MDNEAKRLVVRPALSDMSEWLSGNILCLCYAVSLYTSDYGWRTSGGCGSEAQNLEVPGQYEEVDCVPRPDLHVRVSSFHPSLLVMQSMRKPSRIKVHGSDEADYLFLVRCYVFVLKTRQHYTGKRW
jgi:hypothetical protein